MIKKYIECDCESAEHTLRFILDVENKEIYTEVHLAQHNNPAQRVWAAIKYVFGYRSKYGVYDCVMLSKDNVQELLNMLTAFTQATKPEGVGAPKIRKALKRIKEGEKNAAFTKTGLAGPTT